MPKAISLENLEVFKEELDSQLEALETDIKTDVESAYGQANGVAQLDGSGTVPSAQLPDSVHDILEYNNTSAFPQEGEAGKLYLDKANNILYRWDGTQYVSTSTPEAVKYVAQTLTSEQKVQARTNIGAASASDVSGLSTTVSNLNDRLNNFGNFVREVTETEGGISVRYDNNQTTTIPTGLVFDGGLVDENNDLYLTLDGVALSNDVFAPVHLPEGGGGGGGGSAISLTDVVKPKTARNGKDAIFSFVATASDDTEITVKWYVNNEFITSAINDSGSTFSLNVKDFLNPSSDNSVKVVIESAGEASLSRTWTITTVAFAISWSNAIEPIMLNTANTNVFAPIDVSAEATTNSTITVTVGNHTETRSTHGSLTLTVQLDKTYFQTGVNVVTAHMVNSDDPLDVADDIHFTVIWGTGATTPIVAFADSTIECTQYDNVPIEYFVFDPNNEVASYTIKIGEDDPKARTANRTMQTYWYSPLNEETITIQLACESANATAQLHAARSPYTLSYYVDDSLQYVLDPVGHSNTDVDREQFAGLTFSQNFDWENGGFKTDSDGAAAFVVKKGNSVTLPRCLFEDSDANGKTIDLSFRITNSDQYDAVAMQELNTGLTKGIILRANNGEIRLNNVVGQEFKYCEDSRIDFSVLVENNVAQRVATVWLDGIPANVNKYTTANTLVQNENELVIGSEHCDVWVYAIRVYNSQLTKQQMVQNYISLGSTTEIKVARYRMNTILDNNDRITPAALHTASPNLTIIQISAPRMTTSKSDDVSADITITDGANVLELLGSDGTVFKVQGTSSSAYGRSSYNMDIDFKNTGKKYKISPNAIAVNYLNVKVNVASSENANNINAVDWYNTYQPYLTEPRQRPGVRDTVEGKPCAVFITNTAAEPVWFSSQLVQPNETILYAMGDLCNSKKNKAVFGQDGSGDHPTKACIEVSGNDTEPQRFRSTAAVFNPAADDGKGRWETTELVDGQTKTVKHFEWRMNPSSADLNDVVASWDALVAWVVSTIGDSAKFKREASNYFAVKSLLYHFLFLEYFACYDNVSKNTFYSYDWDEDEQKYLWNIKAAYDMDTILAADNDGKPFGDYGIDYGDTVNGQPGGRQYFNAATNPIWLNIQEAYKSELSSLYTTLRSAGAWNSQSIMSKWDNYQAIRPHAAMILDAFTKYIEPYKTSGMVIDSEVKSYDDSYLPRLQGSKTYWRKQFLTYQTAYMDGKYGYYSKTNSTQFRTNCETGTRSFSIKSYAKTYITLIADDNKVGSRKVDFGQVTTFENVSVGNNTTLYITPDRLVQYIRPLNDTDNSTFTASGALKLTEAILGGETPNTSWPAGTGVSIPSVLLKDLSIRNLPNFSDSLDLSLNVELETLDTRGTNAGLITLPSFAPLTSVQLNACTGISAYNLKKVETFTMASGSNLVSIQMENCNSVTSNAIATYLEQATSSTQSATRRIRAVGVNWTFANLDALSKVAKTWKGYDNLGNEQNAPVVTGTIHVTTLSEKKLEMINDVWGEGEIDDHLDRVNQVWSYGNLTIHYDSLIPYYTITFMNLFNTPIKDRQGNDYVQYIDLGGNAYDPITAGDIDTPTYIDPAGEYRYTFANWTNIPQNVNSNQTVTAVYTSVVITYTVRWYDKQGGTVYDERTDVPYGSEAIYDPNGTIGFPTLADEQAAGYYKVFTGWDKSTGFITQDTDVYATWDRGNLPSTSKALKNMSVAEIYAICSQNKADEYFRDSEQIIKANAYTDIQVGKDFNFSNVESEVLLQNRYFDGTNVLRMNDIKLFDADAPSFTIAVDYEFCNNNSNATIVSCCDSTGAAEGFRVYYYPSQTAGEDQGIRVLWGNSNATIAHGRNRGMLVLRHRKGSQNLLVSADNGGRYITQWQGTAGQDDFPTSMWTMTKYAGYNESIHYSEIPRAQATLTDSVLTFGGVPVGTEGSTYLAKGWIHWCKIWYADLGTDVIRKLSSWPRETWRMQYCGSGRYNKIGSGLLSGASFIANAPLAQYYEMYPQSSPQPGETTSSGGWRNSIMRSFVNGRCFDALPYAWQAIISPVSVHTKGGADRPEYDDVTPDKIYLPSYADMTTVSSEYIATESVGPISWFTENKYRVKFMGINLPENGQIIIGINDPTLLTETYTIREGDIWGKVVGSGTNPSKYYVYISADTIAKHSFLAGRDTDDINNIAAQGTQGGMWVRSMTYWTRTNAATSTGYSASQYAVLPEGNISSGCNISYLEYQERGVVLMFSI